MASADPSRESTAVDDIRTGEDEHAAPNQRRPPTHPRRPRLKPILFLWLSIEMGAGIVALAEIVFALPPVILLEMGRTAIYQFLPLTVASGSGAVYLGWRALPLVHQVAQLGQTAA
ncbi:MAG: hypothetical protein L3K02_06790 [Thermoplasmata archaeon]|nr:hypothetical protein [Thermoplasmata archaeon]